MRDKPRITNERDIAISDSREEGTWEMTGSHFSNINNNVRLMEIRARFTNTLGHWEPWRNMTRIVKTDQQESSNIHLYDSSDVAIETQLNLRGTSRTTISPIVPPITDEGAARYKAVHDRFRINSRSAVWQTTSYRLSKISGRLSTINMENLSDEELRERRERAIRRLDMYRRWKKSREQMIQHIRVLEEYLETIPECGEEEIRQMQKNQEHNRWIIERIAECEQATGREVSLIRDLKVYDHRTKEKLADITLAASIQRKKDQQIPLRVVLDFRDNKIITAASVLADDGNNEDANLEVRSSPMENGKYRGAGRHSVPDVIRQPGRRNIPKE